MPYASFGGVPCCVRRIAIPTPLRILEVVETLVRVRAEERVATAGAAPPGRPAKTRIAYLLSRYPAVSHTFFLHEVMGLRARGAEIETASINPPDRPFAALPPDEQTESKRTFYIKRGSPVHLAFQVCKTIASHPAAFLRGLAVVTRIPNLTLRNRALWLLYLGEAMLVGRWMRQHALAHLHVHFGGPVASVGMLTAAAWRLPFSLTIHGPEELLNTDAYQLREKLAAAAFVFCISDFCRSQLCQLTPPSQWEKFQVLRLGVDPVLLTPVCRPASPAADEAFDTRALELVCTGRLVAAKGHMILLEALRLLRARGLFLRATLIGSGPELARLEDFVAQHGMTGAVTFTSAMSHPQTLALLRRADLFALASFAEGIPVALMEAMSLGVPCVSTSIAGIPELIRSASTASSCRPPTPPPLPTRLSCSPPTRACAGPLARPPANASSRTTTCPSIRSSSPTPLKPVSRLHRSDAHPSTRNPPTTSNRHS